MISASKLLPSSRVTPITWIDEFLLIFHFGKFLFPCVCGLEGIGQNDDEQIQPNGLGWQAAIKANQAAYFETSYSQKVMNRIEQKKYNI